MKAAETNLVSDKYKEFQDNFLETRQPLYAFVFVLVGNTADADDIFQEVYMVMWNKFHQFRSGTNFLAWAKQIARNKVMDMRKQRRRRKMIGFDEDTVDLLAFRYERIQDQVEDRIEALKRCMKKLNEKDRDLVQRTYEKGESIKKIAKKLKVSMQRIYKRLGTIHGALLRCVRRTLSEGEASA